MVSSDGQTSEYTLGAGSCLTRVSSSEVRHATSGLVSVLLPNLYYFSGSHLVGNVELSDM